MRTIELVHAVKASPDALYRVVTDPARLQEWEPGCQESSAVSPLPLTAGSLFRQRRDVMGHETAELAEVTEIRQRGKEWRFAYRVAAPDGTYWRWVQYDMDPTWPTISRIYATWKWHELDGITGEEDEAIRKAMLEGLAKLEALAARG